MVEYKCYILEAGLDSTGMVSTEVFFYFRRKTEFLMTLTEFREISRNSAAFYQWNFVEFRGMSRNSLHFLTRNSVCSLFRCKILLILLLCDITSLGDDTLYSCGQHLCVTYAALDWLFDTCWIAQNSMYLYVQINLKQVYLDSDMSEDTWWAQKVIRSPILRPPCSTDRRRILYDLWVSLFDLEDDLATGKRRETWLHLDMSGKQERVLIWTYLYHRGLSCTWMYLVLSTPQGTELHLYLSGQKDSVHCRSGHIYTIGAWAAPERVNKTGA